MDRHESEHANGVESTVDDGDPESSGRDISDFKESSAKSNSNSTSEPSVKTLPSWKNDQKIGFNPEFVSMFVAIKDGIEKLIEQEKRKLTEHTKVKDKYDNLRKPK